MFSGIVQGTGKISKIISKKNHITLEISAPKNFNKNLKKGASVSVNGICLTSLDNGKKNLKFDVINETLSKTNIGTARNCLLYTSPSPRDQEASRMPSSA